MDITLGKDKSNSSRIIKVLLEFIFYNYSSFRHSCNKQSQKSRLRYIAYGNYESLDV